MNLGTNKNKFLVGVSIILIIGVSVGFEEYRRSVLATETRAQLAMLQQDNKDLEARLSQLTSESKSLVDLLQSEQIQSSTFKSQIGQIASTVGMLDKLSKTDTELLKKYSKVYFLNENYIPSSLTAISTDFTFPHDKTLQIHTNVWPRLESLLKAAQGDGINLRIISAYRSFGTQASLKSSYKVTYGAGTANQFSAEQGYSEHQLGSAVDFTIEELGTNFSNGFDSTKAYPWLTANAYKFGFILSYPKGNSYYQYEPWHWRFVGVDLAAKLHDEGKNFYDLDQRDIDPYLSVIFD